MSAAAKSAPGHKFARSLALQVLAGRRPRGGQGHLALSLRLLAGLAPRRRPGAPTEAFRPRVVDQGRAEDLQERGQCDRSAQAR